MHVGKPFLRLHRIAHRWPNRTARQLASVFPGKIEQDGQHLRRELNRDSVDPIEWFADGNASSNSAVR